MEPTLGKITRTRNNACFGPSIIFLTFESLHFSLSFHSGLKRRQFKIYISLNIPTLYIYIYMCVCVCVCIYIYLNHFAVHLKLTQHCKSTVLQFKKFFKDSFPSLYLATTSAYPSKLNLCHVFPEIFPDSPLCSHSSL